MSFSSDIKEELSKINNFKDKKIIEAEFFGYMLTINCMKNENTIEFVTENEFSIERFYKILFNLNLEYEPAIRGKVFVASIIKNDIAMNYLKLININSDRVQRAIVRGAFMSAGSITDPNKHYHLEISFKEKCNAEYILNICKIYHINIKLLENKEKIELYIKESEEISKFLALIGSNKGVLQFEDVRITKEVKNNVNRLVNCETANINKIINASVNQINDIELIKKMNKFDEMPEELKEIANLRVENPDISLKVLGQLLENPIGKSGVNHRLQKIHEIAERLRR